MLSCFHFISNSIKIKVFWQIKEIQIALICIQLIKKSKPRSITFWMKGLNQASFTNQGRQVV